MAFVVPTPPCALVLHRIYILPASVLLGGVGEPDRAPSDEGDTWEIDISHSHGKGSEHAQIVDYFRMKHAD